MQDSASLLDFSNSSIWLGLACLLTMQIMSVIVTVIVARRNNANPWLWGGLAVFLGIWAVIILALVTPSKPDFPYDTPADSKATHRDR